MLENGGKIQILTSPRLSPADIKSICSGLALQKNTDGSPNGTANLLSNLIASKRLEIKIALPENENDLGIFHEKLGLLYDASGNVIAFSGSMNESSNAFFSNYESIDVFTSWTQDAPRVQQKKFAFNSMWKDNEKGLRVVDFSDIEIEVTPEKTGEISKSPKITLLKEMEVRPQIPASINLREYQKKAVADWAKNNYVGIFDMATGSGKTYTALAGIVQLFYAADKNLGIVIVCPYKNLVEQWADNVAKFKINAFICYSEKKKEDWLDRLKFTVESFNCGIQKQFCAIMTEATFCKAEVQSLLRKLSGKVVLVADEAHRFGSEKRSNKLPENIPYRMALSATIERYKDPVGTKRIYEYFGKKCIAYQLKEAIENGMLTPYFYYPVLVSLDEEELENYLKLTARIGKNLHANKEKISEYTKRLLAKRARVVAGAKSKISALSRIIPKYKEESQILIYCGATKVNESRQIDLVTKMLGNEFGMRVKKFTCEEKAKERESIKENFAEGKHLQALTAIRCLDEGIDIPSVKTAFILASSDNYREYVQRRGRLLRKSPGKNYAVIFDFVTIPIPFEKIKNYDAATLSAVKSLAQKEISRILNFAAISENPFDSDLLAAEIQKKYDITEGEQYDGKGNLSDRR